ncbi:MAG: hypothetical protein A2516_03090 [Alphaproteobacteria bacterium RIFOXYD12_FULL_60_8]|nr:MAG: hypothetical protein A2516_03090 [Alphaproteobacteria bacterium RIFOXYD12_FULL_60_8]
MALKTDDKEITILKHELVELFDHIQIIRKEIAAIRRPGADNDRFLQMSDELDAIVAATEDATNQIMENVEEIEVLVDTARSRTSDPEAEAALSKISEKTSNVFQACSFQDITGQRITKVVRLLKYVEERVNALISVWGEDQIAKTGVDETRPTDPYARYLNGPQLKGEGVSQDDVDALLSGGSVAEKEKKAHLAPIPSQVGVAKADEAKKPEPSEPPKAMDQSAIDSLFD